MPVQPSVTAQRIEIACENCFFRRAELCAIPGNKPCPTFRPCDKTMKTRTPSTTVAPKIPTAVPAAA
jgi:hypothetical protein